MISCAQKTFSLWDIYCLAFSANSVIPPLFVGVFWRSMSPSFGGGDISFCFELAVSVHLGPMDGWIDQ